ncbi:MAG: cyclic nucleotide-binding domain-containing protein [Actinomycetota bacterium]|nr:cyclic nucleotide-binding domain-containing protein [Actinomycetota bacterium]
MAPPVSHSLVEALRTVPDFASLDDATLLQILGVSMNLVWSAGSVVFDEGAPAEALYVVLSGRVRIYEAGEDGEDEVAVMEAGDYFGEHSLLRDTTHSKGARAMQDSELMVIPADSFRALLDGDPDLAGLIEATLRSRVQGGGRPSD